MFARPAMATRKSLPPGYFEGIFAADDDPWKLSSSVYEAAKHAQTIAALGSRRYRSGLEIGCAGGVLTKQLAASCSRLLAIDVSHSALEHAERRCEGLDNVTFAEFDFPKWSGGSEFFDLMVLSEVAYYWGDDDLAAAANLIRSRLVPSGHLLLVHWTGETDYPQTGDGATDALYRALTDILTTDVSERRAEYRLDLWRRR